MKLLVFAFYGCLLAGCTSGGSAAMAPPQAGLVTVKTRCTKPFAKAGPLRFESKGWNTDFCQHSVPYKEIHGGGPPRDGIPPIDTPKFVSVAEASAWLEAVEPVIALQIEGRARAYPLQILMWHEIVNDELSGIPIAVTFCPLCYAALVFRRPIVAGQLLSFGTSGNLRKSDMVMWDRETESWWQQFEGLGIVGSMTGTQLEIEPAAIVSWKSFSSQFPTGEVLSRETGIKRPYGQNPYVGYDDVAKQPFLFQGKVEKGLPPMAHVVGLQVGKKARAYPVELLKEKGVLNDVFAGQQQVLFWNQGSASALDSKHIAQGVDVGEIAVFSRQVDDLKLRFVKVGQGVYEDEQTRSRWNLFGRALSGPLAGQQLTAIAHHRVFWFAWSAFVVERGSLYRP